MTRPDQLERELRELLHRRAARVTSSLDGPALRALATPGIDGLRPARRRAITVGHALLAAAAVLLVALGATLILGHSHPNLRPPAGVITPATPVTTVTSPTPHSSVSPNTAATTPVTTTPVAVGPATVPSITLRPTTPPDATDRPTARVS